MEKLFAFSLYGNNSIYINGSINNAKLIPELFGTEWKVRFYTRDVSEDTIQKLKKLNAEVIDMTNSDIKNGRLFRFLAIKQNNLVMVRDCDSIVTVREKMMVNEFINSGKKLHIIRDHPNHKEHMMACSFGFNKSGVEMKDIIYKSGLKDNLNYIMDQVFLAKFIYPSYKSMMLIHDNFNHYYRERSEIILKYPRVINHIGQRVIDNVHEDTSRLEEFKGYVKFAKNNFKSMHELMEYFCNYLSISRSLKRKYIFDKFYVKDEMVLLDDYILIKELYRYTFIVRSCDVKEELVISKDALGVPALKLSDIIKFDEIKENELISFDIDILNDSDYDPFTLYNVIQLNDDLNYRFEEYIVKNNIDKYNTVILHEKLEAQLPEAINYDTLFNDFSDEKNLNELLRLFSGIFRIHVKPNNLVCHFSKRYWHQWDDEFKIVNHIN